MQDGALLEKYVRKTKTQMIRVLSLRTIEALMPETLGAMARLPPATSDAPAVSIPVVVASLATARSPGPESENASAVENYQ